MPRVLLMLLALLALPVQALELKPFSASYTADWKQVPISGTAGRSLKALDNGRWELDFEASMLVASLKETSTLRMESDAFLPLTYRFDRSGLGKSKQIELDFDWTEKQVLGNDRGEPVRFRFFGSSVRRQDEVGTLLDFWQPDELQELEEIEATLPAEGRRPGEVVRVKLHARVTETGTLELEALPVDGSARWKVQFDVRGTAEA